MREFLRKRSKPRNSQPKSKRSTMSQKRKNRTRKKYRKKINQQFQIPQLPRLLQLSLKTMWFQHHKLLPLRILTKSQPQQTQFLRGKRTKKIVLFTELHFIYCYIYFLHYMMPICENKIFFFLLSFLRQLVKKWAQSD